MRLTRDSLTDLCNSLIYHGRHFHKKRDKIVVEKAVEYIMGIIEQKVLRDCQ